ncbi:Leucine-rich repeat protein kinase family protein [Rhynchospora pubera]|uniref:Leucine-rich repeat protein kinase family protein n=1 Tax=Rhynchospora pubera TaxID=906938 RepID=A0AAV8C0E5_9POAL|nr:Leucine-rich repeat protein kinase family protein [Rhynchospora pubera]
MPLALTMHPLSLSLFFLLSLFLSPLSALNQDGVLLLSFKYAIASDPYSSLSDWNYLDDTPCSWNGVMCMGFASTNTSAGTTTGTNSTSTSFLDTSAVASTTISRVISLVLPNSQLAGTLVPELGLIEHLRHVELSGNSLNGTIPTTFFNATELRILSLADNLISGGIPAPVPGQLTDLQVLNLSANGIAGTLPNGITLLPNLTFLSLSNNYLSGELPSGGFASLESLDLSSNLINGSIPADLGTKNLKLLNLSSNRLTGQIPPELGLNFLANATIDLSFNNLTGQIPQTAVFLNQRENAFAGNGDLCGKPLLEKPCTIPSTLSNPPNSTESKSPPAIAVMPKNAPEDTNPGTSTETSGRRGLRPIAILAIAVGDVAGIAILFLIFLYVYQIKKRKQVQEQPQEKRISNSDNREFGVAKLEKGVKEDRSLPASKAKGLSCCVGNKNNNEEETDESSESSAWSDRDETELKNERGDINDKSLIEGATLVTVDGERELEMDTLLKASAYILGATGSSIVYKAVLSDGTSLAVRRIGESSCVTRFKDFDAQVKVLAKFKHPNLLRVRGFYWGADEKLLIHEYAVNGSLANISFNKKLGSSPFHMSWETRLRIARGTARGLSYLHEKKCVHGNIKPSNILLNADFDALIADFGLERLMVGDPVTGFKPGSSARLFGSKRSMHSTSSLPDLSQMPGASPSGPGSASSIGMPIPYHAPESLKNLKPNPKWDIYSFGVVLLELIAGRVLSEVELCQWNGGFMDEERNRILRMVDPALRGEIEGKEEVLLTCFKLGFSCCAVTPQKRPSMKEVVQVLERICATSASTSSH